MDLQLRSSGSSSTIWKLPSALEELILCGDEETVAEIFELFRTDTASRLRLVRTAFEANDRARIRAQAHAMKGSAVQVGADHFAAACAELENQAPEASAELALLLLQLESRFRETIAAIAQARNGEAA